MSEIKEHRQQEIIPVKAENQAIKDQSNELVGKDQFIDYFNVSSFLFMDYYGTQKAIEKTSRSYGGYVELKVYIPKKDQPTINILRHHATYNDGKLDIQDTVIVDNELLSAQNKEKQIELNFSVNAAGQLTKRPQLSHEPQRSTREQSYQNYVNSLVDGFTKASQKEGSSIYIGNSKKFISDGTKWVPAPLPPVVDLHNPGKPA